MRLFDVTLVRRTGIRFVGLTLAGILAASATPAASEPIVDASAKPVPRIIISTDVAIGLIDTHGGKSLTPVSFDADHAYTTDTNVAPQDIDDGLTLAMALNLDAAGQIDLLAVVPTYGNASLPAEMLVARQIISTLKKRKDIPVAPGAIGPAAQILNPTAKWFNGKTTKITGRKGSFALSCGNEGVSLMRDTLLADEGLGKKPTVTILAIGPLTDVACLLNTAPKRAIRNINEIIVLASRTKDSSVAVNGKVVNDFNFRMDPVGGTLMLAAGKARSVPIRLMSFGLTGQTSQTAGLFGFDAATYPGRKPSTAASRKSFKWLLEASEPRQAYWKGIFGTIEGPFDQYTLAAALKPEVFDCQAGLAYVQMCPYPAWSSSYPVSSGGDPTEEPYNTPVNPCVDHGTANGSSLSEVPAQLVVSSKTKKVGALVRGISGIDGNIPALNGKKARAVMVCTDFANSRARTKFEKLLKDWTW